MRQPGVVDGGSVDHESLWIQQDLPQTTEGIDASVQHEQCGLGSDQHPHLVGDHESGATDHRDLGQQDLHLFLQLQLQVGGQAGEERHATSQDLAPGGRERLTRDAPASSRAGGGGTPQPRPDHAGERSEEEQGPERRHPPICKPRRGVSSPRSRGVAGCGLGRVLRLDLHGASHRVGDEAMPVRIVVQPLQLPCVG